MNPTQYGDMMASNSLKSHFSQVATKRNSNFLNVKTALSVLQLDFAAH